MTAEQLAALGYQPQQGGPSPMPEHGGAISQADLNQFYAQASGAPSDLPALNPVQPQVDPAMLNQLMGTPMPADQLPRVRANQLAMMSPSDPNGFTSMVQLGNPGSPGTDPSATGASVTSVTSNQAAAPSQTAAAQGQPLAALSGFPQFADWAKAAGLPRQVMPEERKVILEKYLDQQKDFLARQDPEKQIKIQEAKLALNKTTTEQAESLAKKVDAVPEVQNNIQLLDDLLTHKGLPTSVGAKGAAFLFGLKGEPIAGTDSADFMERVKQVQGKNFLTAFNQLKGAGQITEIEGAKAQAAIGRLGTNQSEKAFRESVGELRGILQTGMERSRERLGINARPASASSAPSGSPQIRTTARGTFQSLGNGQWVQIK